VTNDSLIRSNEAADGADDFRPTQTEVTSN